MPAYRIYFLDQEGHVARPPQIIEADNDQQVSEVAKQLKDGLDIEVWLEARLVMRYPHR